MKRRQILRSIVSLPAITALPAIAQPQAPAPQKTAAGADDTLKLSLTNADAIADAPQKFFSPEQFHTLQRLCDLIIPASDPRPGAKQAAVPEFLDFLISRSPHQRQALYQHGLDRLNAESQRRFRVKFADASVTQADALLTPLRAPWTYQGPSDEIALFLTTAKEDLLRATINSREWAAASTGRRGGSGIGSYWYSLD
jgi:hypothetical protein